MKKILLSFLLFLSAGLSSAQVIDTDKVLIIGRNALHYEDYILSIQYFNQVIKAKPYLAEPYYFRGIAKFLLEDYKGAAEDFTSCLDRNPFIANAYAYRADARLNSGENDGAIADYDKTLNDDPKNKIALINQSIAYIQKKDYDKAKIRLDSLISIYPTFTQGILTRGGMYIEKGDSISAMKDYDAAIKQDPTYMQAYSNRGLLYINLKKYDEALKDLDEAIRLDPLIVSNYMNRGLTRYYKDDYRGAMKDFDKVVEFEPNNIQGRFNRALLRAQVGDSNNAIADLNIVLASETENYIAYYNRAILKNETGDLKGAIADLDKVLTKHPDFYQGFYLRADLKRRTMDSRGSDADLRYAKAEEDRIRKEVFAGRQPSKKGGEKTREKSDDTMDNFNLLMVADKKEQEKSKYGDGVRGRVQNQQAKVELEPMFVLSYYEKTDDARNAVYYKYEVDALNKKGILEQKLRIVNHESALSVQQIESHFASINEWSKQIDSNKEDSLLYLARSIDYMLVQDMESAISDLNKAIVINPKFALAHFMLGIAYSKQLELKENSKSEISAQANQPVLKESLTVGVKPVVVGSLETENAEYNLAIKSFDKVVDIDKNFTYAYYNRANIKAQVRNYKDAIMDYSEAIRIDKDFAEAYFNRGICRLFMGEKDRGLADLRKAGELGVVNAYSIVKRMSK